MDITQEIVGKGFKLVGGRAQPRQYRVRIDSKHPGHRANAQPFGQGSDHLHEKLGRYSLAGKESPMGFKKVGVTGNALELAPGATTRMAVRTEIALPGPAIVGTRFLWTVMAGGVPDHSWTPALGNEQRRR